MKMLTDALAQNTSLTSLDVRNNDGVSSALAHRLVQAITAHPALGVVCEMPAKLVLKEQAPIVLAYFWPLAWLESAT